MIEILYTASFLREAKRLTVLDKDLGDEIAEKIELFLHRKNHTRLKVHKLRGSLSGFSSFSINYKYRIVFEFGQKNKAVFHDIGNHDVYK